MSFGFSIGDFITVGELAFVSDGNLTRFSLPDSIPRNCITIAIKLPVVHRMRFSY